METRTNWGILAVAFGAAAVLIIVSLYVSTRTPDEPTLAATPAIEAGAQETPVNEGWRTALDAIAMRVASTTGEYRAPAELPTTQAVSQELVATYFKLKAQNQLGTKAADEALNDLIERNVVAITPAKTYTADMVVKDGSATLDTYAQSIGDTMEQAALVKEYELTTFARTVGVEDFDGTPSLLSAARMYRTIESQLVAMRVPPALASEHASVATSVAYLAQSVELMGNWNGDPMDALAYVDAFVKAERQTQVAFNALFAAMIELGKAS